MRNGHARVADPFERVRDNGSAIFIEALDKRKENRKKEREGRNKRNAPVEKVRSGTNGECASHPKSRASSGINRQF